MLAALLFALVLPQAAAAADETFVVQNIQVQGLERISTGTFYTYLPISIGDRVGPARIAAAIKALYKTGFFKSIQMRRDGNTLIVVVGERPSIEYFSLTGNKAISSDNLNKTLSSVGLAQGRIFNRSVLKDVKQELTETYFSHGNYNVRIDTKVTPKPHNKVDVSIKISEGVTATIKSIDIVGNKTFSDEELLNVFKLHASHFLSFLESDDKYEREKLSGDLESLRSYYLDRGYADFHIESVQVAISPDYKSIYITIDVNEGTVYKVRNVKLAGVFVVPESELRQLVLVSPGTTFSMARATATSTLMGNLLGNHGYAFAKIDPIPTLDKKTHQVDLTFFVTPGDRIYVRRINFVGMPDTDDVVFRREMRQMEGTWLSNVNLKRSKIRLQRLRFVKDVKESTDPVAGVPDMVDLNYTLEAQQAGMLQAAVGYSPQAGILLNGEIQHSNFLGAGDTIDLSLNTSQIAKSYSLSFTDPYATVNGVSRSVSLSYQKSTALIIDTSPLDTTTYGGSLSYGIPISEFDSIAYGASASHTELLASLGSSQQFIEFASDPRNGTIFKTPVGNGIRYRQLDLLTGWTHDTRNRVLFASRGDKQHIGLDITTPPSDVHYYRLSFDTLDFVPLGAGFVYQLNGAVALNKTFGSTHTVPPTQHYFAGGPDSVRGFKAGFLGPTDPVTGFPVGGNFQVYAQNEIIIPSLFGLGGEQAQKSSRFSVFFDIGNVFAESRDFNFGALYRSVGVAGEFLTPLGIMRVSIAKPLTSVPGRLRETFQFEIGRYF
jgi:outer membrane protein insertion porin family